MLPSWIETGPENTGSSVFLVEQPGRVMVYQVSEMGLMRLFMFSGTTFGDYLEACHPLQFFCRPGVLSLAIIL